MQKILQINFTKKSQSKLFQRKFLYIKQGVQKQPQIWNCYPCEQNLQEKSFIKHLKSKTHLFITGGNVICGICTNLYEPQNRKAHLQSQQCTKKKKHIVKFVKLFKRHEHNNPKKPKKCIRRW